MLNSLRVLSGSHADRAVCIGEPEHCVQFVSRRNPVELGFLLDIF